MDRIKRSFTWHEIRGQSGHGSYCKGTEYQFTEQEALLFLQELKESPQHGSEELQVVRVTLTEKTIHPK